MHAAGAIVWRPSRKSGELEILLIHRPRWRDWSFPKGKLKAHEPLHRCAVREVYEETGVHIILGQPLGWQYYETDDLKWKEVRYWAAKVTDKTGVVGQSRPKFSRAKHSEVDDAVWVDSKEAEGLLTYDYDRKLLRRLLAQHAAGQLDTVALCILRHTRAKSRSAWHKGKDAEATRPLTSLGERRARRLCEPLSDFGVTELISSPWKRCVDTLLPYSKLIDTKIQLKKELTEDAYRKSESGTEKVLRRAIEKTSVATAIALHRPTLPTVLNVLADYTKKSVLKQIPASDPWLKTGEVIVAHVVRNGKQKPVVAAVEKLRPVALD